MKYEIKKLGPISMFKTTLYFASIPVALMFVFGFFALLIGMAIGSPQVIISVIPFLVMPVIMFGLYGLIGMLSSVVYNFLASKFGGLEITVEPRNEDQMTQQTY